MRPLAAMPNSRAGPARLFGTAAKGRIAVGYDADLTVVDLKRRETILDRWIASRAGWTPYAGVTVTGWPVGTLIRGNKVMWEGSLTTPARGERVRFLETLASSGFTGTCRRKVPGGGQLHHASCPQSFLLRQIL